MPSARLEKLSRFANWVNENDRASGRGGTGCVGGSKNLKAIVINAKKDIVRTAAERGWRRHRNVPFSAAEENITSHARWVVGLWNQCADEHHQRISALPTKNSQKTAFGDGAEPQREYVKENVLVNDPTCHACPAACKGSGIKEGPGRGCAWNRWSMNPPGHLEPTAETVMSTPSPN